MALKDDLKKDLEDTFNPVFNSRDGRVVPSAEGVKLGNDAVKLDATILYADMDGSTRMVDEYRWWFAAKVYKSYLRCACKVIRAFSGDIVGFDGDRVMAVFIGDSKNTNATKAALKINYVRVLINNKIAGKYSGTSFELNQCVGVDTSELRAIRTGIRGSNDLVWVGRAANHAAKMTELGTGNYRTWISKEVYKSIADESKYGKEGKNMWEECSWTPMSRTIYRSSYHWGI